MKVRKFLQGYSRDAPMEWISPQYFCESEQKSFAQENGGGNLMGMGFQRMSLGFLGCRQNNNYFEHLRVELRKVQFKMETSK